MKTVEIRQFGKRLGFGYIKVCGLYRFSIVFITFSINPILFFRLVRDTLIASTFHIHITHIGYEYIIYIIHLY